MKLSFFPLLLVSSMASADVQKLKLCLTGSTEKALPKYGEAFVNGAQLAVSELSTADRSRVELEINYYESNPLAPIGKLVELRQKNCDTIIGFSTGNDLLSIEQSLKDAPILTVSIYGDPQDRFNETSYLRTLQPSAVDLVSYLFKKLPFRLRKASTVLMVTAVDRSEMLSYREAYLENLKKKGVSVTQVEVLEQTHDLKKFEEILTQNKKWDYVIILTRSLVAASISDQIHRSSKPIILGTKYFGSSDLPAFYDFLKNKNVEAYIPRQNCSCDTAPDFRRVFQNYQKKFGLPPMSISIDSYDVTKFLLQALKAKKLDADTVLQFMGEQKFEGVTSMKVDKGLRFTSSKRFLMKIDKTGYREAK